MTACGGGVESSTHEPTEHVAPASLALQGSYDLRFTTVTAATETSSFPAPDAKPPSLEVNARLDLRQRDDKSYEAVFTGRWGTPAAYSVTVTDDALTLSGSGSISQVRGSISGASDRWTTLVLARGADGRLTGKVRGVGDETIGEGDVMWNATLTGNAELTVDATTPEVRSAAISPLGPDDALLPWDPIVIETAEPLMPDALQQATVIHDPRGAMSLRWDHKVPGADGWAGATSIVGHVDDWARAGNNGQKDTLDHAGGVRDRAGLGTNVLGVPVQFVAIGPAMKSIGFDDDVTSVGMWGASEILGGGLAGTNDPRCESGGCARIGPVHYGVCGVEHAGFAAQLQRATGGKVALRYRVLVGDAYNRPAEKPFVYGSSVSLQLATPGEVPVVVGVTFDQASLTQLPTAVDGLGWGTPWTTIEAPAHEGSGQGAPIGFAVAAGGAGASRGGCGGPPPPETKFEILVERVDAK
jgi:hypothetical protein